MRNVVRRATLCLDSDLTPDTELLADGSKWRRLAWRPTAGRSARQAAIRVDAAPRAYFLRAQALSWLPAGQEADAVLAELCVSELTDDDRGGSHTYAPSTRYGLSVTPCVRKTSSMTRRVALQPPARLWIDAFLTVYWFALDRPQEAIQASKSLVLEDLPAVAGAETAWVLAVMYADIGQTAKAVAVANTGYAVASRFFDSPQ